MKGVAMQVPREGVRAEVSAFLAATLGQELGDDDDYFALGLVSSMLAIELVTFVEHRFGFAVDVDDLDLDNFRTVARLTDFVLARTEPAGVPVP